MLRLANGPASPIFAAHVGKNPLKTTVYGLMASFGARRAEGDGLYDLTLRFDGR